MLKILLVIPACFVLGASARGNVTLPDLFADHMVFQSGTPISIWGWADAGESITLTLQGQTAKTTASAEGKWTVSLPAQKAGGPCTVEIDGNNKRDLTDVLIGDVWLASGQSNMDMRLYPTPPWTHGVIDYEKEIAAANHPEIRFFTVTQEASETPKEDIHGLWQVCSPANAANFSAVAYFFAQKINTDVNVPVGMIVSSVGATSITSWLEPDLVSQLPAGRKGLESAAVKRKAAGPAMDEYRARLPAYYAKAKADRATPGRLTVHPEPYKGYIFQPSGCYNAMIAPIVRFPVKGFLWYQGESDSSWAAGYTAALETLIRSWRDSWKAPDAPFLIIQISGHGFSPTGKVDSNRATSTADNWPKLRLAQAAALDVPRTALVVTCDLGDQNLIHYPRKKEVGERLARAALKLAYGRTIDYRGPVATKVSAAGERLFIEFQNDGGSLQSKSGRELTGFEIAGADQVFHPAIGKIENNGVVVTSPDVKTPRTVRYGWAEFPAMSLYDAEGLPAAPFICTVPKNP